MKAIYRTDQTNVPDSLPQRHHLCSRLDCVCVCVCIQTKLPVCCSVWKAISTQPLSCNTIAFVCVYCVYSRVPFLPAVIQHGYLRGRKGPLAPVSEGRLSWHPTGRPLHFSAFSVGVSVCLEMCLCVCGWGWHHTSCLPPDCTGCLSVTYFGSFSFVFCLDILFWKATGKIYFFIN